MAEEASESAGAAGADALAQAWRQEQGRIEAVRRAERAALVADVQRRRAAKEADRHARRVARMREELHVPETGLSLRPGPGPEGLAAQGLRCLGCAVVPLRGLASGAQRVLRAEAPVQGLRGPVGTLSVDAAFVAEGEGAALEVWVLQYEYHQTGRGRCGAVGSGLLQAVVTVRAVAAEDVGHARDAGAAPPAPASPGAVLAVPLADGAAALHTPAAPAPLPERLRRFRHDFVTTPTHFVFGAAARYRVPPDRVAGVAAGHVLELAVWAQPLHDRRWPAPPLAEGDGPSGAQLREALAAAQARGDAPPPSAAPAPCGAADAPGAPAADLLHRHPPPVRVLGCPASSPDAVDFVAAGQWAGALECDVVVPLGCDCSAAQALRFAGLRHAAFPFDWLKAEPGGIRAVLAEERAALFRDAAALRCLAPDAEGGGNAYRDSPGGAATGTVLDTATGLIRCALPGQRPHPLSRPGAPRVRGSAAVVGTRGVLRGLDFCFFVKDRPWGLPQGTTNRQPPPTASGDQPSTANRQSLPTATNHQSPTTNHHQLPPTASRQPPTADRHQPPTANCHQPPTSNRHQPRLNI